MSDPQFFVIVIKFQLTNKKEFVKKSVSKHKKFPRNFNPTTSLIHSSCLAASCSFAICKYES